MSYHLAPIANEQSIDANGSPVSGGKITTYIAGTTTPATTYTDDSGATPQANPIILNSLGLPASPVWLQSGRAYKFVFTDADGVQTRPTVDDVTGINDASVALDQWAAYANAATYISATSFSVAGDQTGTFQVSRRIKSANTGGTIYSTITASAFAAGITTVTVANDSGALDAGLSQVSYALLSAQDDSIPRRLKSALVGTTTNDSAAAGIVGEYVSSTVLFAERSAVVNNTAKAITSISLTAGDWDVEGRVGFTSDPTTTVTRLGACINTSVAASVDVDAAAQLIYQPASTLNTPTNGSVVLPVNRARISLAATTTIYLVGIASFATAAAAAFGRISARRVR